MKEATGAGLLICSVFHIHNYNRQTLIRETILPSIIRGTMHQRLKFPFPIDCTGSAFRHGCIYPWVGHLWFALTNCWDADSHQHARCRTMIKKCHCPLLFGIILLSSYFQELLENCLRYDAFYPCLAQKSERCSVLAQGPMFALGCIMRTKVVYDGLAG